MRLRRGLRKLRRHCFSFSRWRAACHPSATADCIYTFSCLFSPRHHQSYINLSRSRPCADLFHGSPTASRRPRHGSASCEPRVQAHFSEREPLLRVRIEHLHEQVSAQRATQAFRNRSVISEADVPERRGHVSRVVRVFEGVDAAHHQVQRHAHAPYVRPRRIVRFDVHWLRCANQLSVRQSEECATWREKRVFSRSEATRRARASATTNESTKGSARKPRRLLVSTTTINIPSP